MIGIITQLGNLALGAAGAVVEVVGFDAQAESNENVTAVDRPFRELLSFMFSSLI